jgi:hypothetical protein
MISECTVIRAKFTMICIPSAIRLSPHLDQCIFCPQTWPKNELPPVCVGIMHGQVVDVMRLQEGQRIERLRIKQFRESKNPDNQSMMRLQEDIWEEQWLRHGIPDRLIDPATLRSRHACPDPLTEDVDA